MKTINTSAKSIVQPAYRISHNGGNSVDNEGDFVEISSQLCKGCTHDICKCHCNCNLSKGKGKIHPRIGIEVLRYR